MRAHLRDRLLAAKNQSKAKFSSLRALCECCSLFVLKDPAWKEERARLSLDSVAGSDLRALAARRSSVAREGASFFVLFFKVTIFALPVLPKQRMSNYVNALNAEAYPSDAFAFVCATRQVFGLGPGHSCKGLDFSLRLLKFSGLSCADYSTKNSTLSIIVSTCQDSMQLARDPARWSCFCVVADDPADLTLGKP